MKVLVTGATGFVGHALLPMLRGRGHTVRAAGRRSVGSVADETVITGELAPDSDWHAAVAGIEAIVHLAARVHVMHDTAADPLAEFRRANVDGTLALAKTASQAGVRRFVFVSSIKVNGETTSGRAAFTADDVPSPADPYGMSKREAEEALLVLARQTGMEVVVIRPPLVYGPRVAGNFQSMVRWLQRPVPLPLGAIHNRRTLVALDNLVDLIATCVDHPAATNQVFLAGDAEDLSTTQLLRRLAQAMGVPARLIPVPVSLLRIGLTLLGRRAVAQRLCGNLQIDTSKALRLLGWVPPVSVDEGLQRTAEYFVAQPRP